MSLCSVEILDVFEVIRENLQNAQPWYSSSVKSISLGIDYAVALLSDGRLYLHIIENNSIQPERETKIFPEGPDQSLITSALIRGEMMIYVTIKGKLTKF